MGRARRSCRRSTRCTPSRTACPAARDGARRPSAPPASDRSRTTRRSRTRRRPPQPRRGVRDHHVDPAERAPERSRPGRGTPWTHDIHDEGVRTIGTELITRREQASLRPGAQIVTEAPSRQKRRAIDRPMPRPPPVTRPPAPSRPSSTQSAYVSSERGKRDIRASAVPRQRDLGADRERRAARDLGLDRFLEPGTSTRYGEPGPAERESRTTPLTTATVAPVLGPR